MYVENGLARACCAVKTQGGTRPMGDWSTLLEMASYTLDTACVVGRFLLCCREIHSFIPGH